MKIALEIQPSFPELGYKLRCLLPEYWLMGESYSEAWDKKLLSLMQEHKFKVNDQYTASIGGINIWISNHPYSSFTPYNSAMPRVRPKRTTLMRAWEKLITDSIGDP